MLYLIEIIYKNILFRKNILAFLLGTLLLSFGALGCGGENTNEASPDLTGVIQPGVTGKACVVSETEYTITDGRTEERRTKKLSPQPLSDSFRGSMGGQIRSVAQVGDLLLWGGGASIRYGNEQGLQGSFPFEKPGSVTDLLPSRVDPERLFVATEKRLGSLRVKGSALGQMEVEGMRPFPLGALAMASKQSESSESLYVVTRDGYVVSTTSENVTKGEGCYDILSSSAVMVQENTSYRPVDVVIAGDFAVVLSLRKSASKHLNPNFSENYAPLFESLIDGKEGGIVRAIDRESHGLLRVGVETLDQSEIGYDRFMPTGIAVSEEEVYVAGIAYEKETVDRFVTSKCPLGELDAKITCLANEAKKGTLTTLKTSSGLSAFVGGLYIYRNFQDLTRPAHFEWIPLSSSLQDEDAIPLTLSVTTFGGQVVLRAPNFLSILTKDVDPITNKERWSVSNQLDGAAGLSTGIPTHVMVYQHSDKQMIAVTAVAPEHDDGTGFSSLMISNNDGVMKTLDTGALRTKIEGASSSSVMAIDLMNKQGGALYLQTPYERDRLEIPGKPDALVSHATLKNDRLAFVWSDPASRQNPKPSLHIVVTQRGSEARGELVVTREGANGHFDGFPSIQGKTSEETLRMRTIADIELTTTHLFVLYEGYESERWYFQVGMYDVGAGRPVLVSLSETIAGTGSENFEGSRFVRIAETGPRSTITFMGADGLYRADMESNGSSRAVFQRRYEGQTFVHASCDVIDGRRCVSLEGSALYVLDSQNLSRTQQEVSISRSEDSTLDRLYYARTRLIGTKLFVTTPYGASARFSMFDVATNGTTSLASSCASCGFNDLASFPDYPSILFVSSPTGGVEMYDISR